MVDIQGRQETSFDPILVVNAHWQVCLWHPNPPELYSSGHRNRREYVNNFGTTVAVLDSFENPTEALPPEAQVIWGSHNVIVRIHGGKRPYRDIVSEDGDDAAVLYQATDFQLERYRFSGTLRNMIIESEMTWTCGPRPSFWFAKKLAYLGIRDV